MNTLEKHIVFVIVIQPRLVDCCWTRVVVIQNRWVWLLPEDAFALHALDDLLSAVSMMNIKIDDRNFSYFVSVCALQVCSSNCDVIDVAKAVCVFLVTHIIFECGTKHTSMMPGWSNCTKSILIFVKHHFVACFYYGTCWQQRSIPRLSRHARVPVISLYSPVSVNWLTFVYHGLNIPVVVYFQDIWDIGRNNIFLQLIPWVLGYIYISGKYSFVCIHKNHETLSVFRLMLFLLHSFHHIGVVFETRMFQTVRISYHKSSSVVTNLILEFFIT